MAREQFHRAGVGGHDGFFVLPRLEGECVCTNWIKPGDPVGGELVSFRSGELYRVMLRGYFIRGKKVIFKDVTNLYGPVKFPDTFLTLSDFGRVRPSSAPTST